MQMKIEWVQVQEDAVMWNPFYSQHRLSSGQCTVVSGAKDESRRQRQFDFSSVSVAKNGYRKVQKESSALLIS